MARTVAESKNKHPLRVVIDFFAHLLVLGGTVSDNFDGKSTIRTGSKEIADLIAALAILDSGDQAVLEVLVD